MSAGIPGGCPYGTNPHCRINLNRRTNHDFRNLPSPGGKGDREAVDEERRAPSDCTVPKSALSPGHPCPRLTPRSGTLCELQLPRSSSVSSADSFPPGEAKRDTCPRVSAGIPGGMPLRPGPTLPHKPKSTHIYEFPRRDTRPRVSAGIPGGMPLRPEPTSPRKSKLPHSRRLSP